jgi:hypothetical protein
MLITCNFNIYMIYIIVLLLDTNLLRYMNIELTKSNAIIARYNIKTLVQNFPPNLT